MYIYIYKCIHVYCTRWERGCLEIMGKFILKILGCDERCAKHTCDLARTVEDLWQNDKG